MKIHEIENMSAAELKANKDELAKGCKFHTDLSQRYIQARMDAKLRDERMAEYGKQITELESVKETLTQQVSILKDKTVGLESMLASNEKEFEKLQKKHDRLDERKQELQASNQALYSSNESLKVQLEQAKRFEIELQVVREELNKLKNAPTKES